MTVEWCEAVPVLARLDRRAFPLPKIETRDSDVMRLPSHRQQKLYMLDVSQSIGTLALQLLKNVFITHTRFMFWAMNPVQ